MKKDYQILLYSCLSVVIVTGCVSCSTSQPADNSAAANSIEDGSAVDYPFQITWPLEDPLNDKRPKSRTLLHGQLRVRPAELGTPRARMVLRVTLIRPEDDEYRQFWNDRLMYEQFAWMEQVRVWDKDHKWLYPNLAYLFKLHGVDRVGRYGGWDPGKQVDNDFGAVLVRVFEADGESERPETKSAPLVSADWHADDARGASRYAIVHRARSDDFSIHLPTDRRQTRVRAKVWLIYGDFFGHPRPRSWPTESAGVGGALAFFSVDWDYRSKPPRPPVIRQQRPEPTGFDWPAWIGRTREDAAPVGTPRLTVSLGATDE